MKSMHKESMEHLGEFANKLADVARATLGSLSQGGITPIYKEDNSPVTEQDKAVEKAMRQLIQSSFPGHGIYGEEYGALGVDADYVWVLDPIDGTSAFIAGLPTYCTLIGLCYRGKPILGVIDNVVTNSRWIGIEGEGSFLNGTALKSRVCPNLSDASLTTYSPEMFEGSEQKVLTDVVAATRMAVYGGNSFAYGRLAGGFLDAGIEARHDVSDYIPLVPIIQNAGGVITDWEGRELSLGSGDRFIAAGDSNLHSALCALTSI